MNYKFFSFKLDYFFVQNLRSLTLDSLESSHPIREDVNNPDEINEIFDTITYGKGASIIRMMNAFLSENTFRSGVSVRIQYQYHILKNKNFNINIIFKNRNI